MSLALLYQFPSISTLHNNVHKLSHEKTALQCKIPNSFTEAGFEPMIPTT
jgi:hypothetical protein